MAIPLRKASDIEKLRIAGKAVAATLDHLEKNVKAGMTLLEVDAMGEKYLRALGARPAFKGLYGFPNAVCTSLNEVVIHGMPTNEVLKEGDILGIDIGSEIDGWYGDAAITMPIGKISKEDEALIACSKDALYHAIDIIRDGMRFKELSLALEEFITGRGYVPLVKFCGHGIGQKFHKEPNILHYGKKGTGEKIKTGMIFTIEPMINAGNYETKTLNDGWTAVTKDKSLSAQFEHTVGITKDGYEIFTQSINSK